MEKFLADQERWREQVNRTIGRSLILEQQRLQETVSRAASMSLGFDQKRLASDPDLRSAA